ncbi:MAG: MAPEG family protein [Deltaproteobacteria bacterium]
MSRAQLILPLVIQVLLTIVLYVVLVVRKKRAARAGEVNEARRALFEDAWPEHVIQVNNCIRNQFEVPVLFYVSTLSLFVLDAADGWAVGLAWAFVLSRIAHALVHTTRNHVPTRRRIFTVGVALVLALAGLVARAALSATA